MKLYLLKRESGIVIETESWTGTEIAIVMLRFLLIQSMVRVILNLIPMRMPSLLTIVRDPLHHKISVQRASYMVIPAPNSNRIHILGVSMVCKSFPAEAEAKQNAPQPDSEITAGHDHRIFEMKTSWRSKSRWRSKWRSMWGWRWSWRWRWRWRWRKRKRKKKRKKRRRGREMNKKMMRKKDEKAQRKRKAR